MYSGGATYIQYKAGSSPGSQEESIRAVLKEYEKGWR